MLHSDLKMAHAAHRVTAAAHCTAMIRLLHQIASRNDTIHMIPTGILYTSKETHYSVMKAARMYRVDAVEVTYCRIKEWPDC